VESFGDSGAVLCCSLIWGCRCVSGDLIWCGRQSSWSGVRQFCLVRRVCGLVLSAEFGGISSSKVVGFCAFGQVYVGS
jgi:hypothetical protein